ncbi:PH domain-containing protein [Nocardioides sp.]|uniref:PH domain-containing protein n=1 Tax=Nocardioides sp. TaxID=35761 RepID=UPI00262964C9|nr:PH domain-containing protein [Nocardioides sp.]
MGISTRLLNDGEDVVVSTRTHPKALILPAIVLVVSLAIGLAVQIRTSTAILQIVVWILVVAAFVIWCVWPLMNWLAATYTITNRRLITRHGVLTRRGHDIPLSRVSDVEYEMDLIDRVLGCGTLIISDASTDGEVKLPDIPRVEEVQRQLNHLIHVTDGGKRGE